MSTKALKSTNHRRPRLPKQIEDSMNNILDMLWEDEMRDYLGRSRADQDGHVFEEMLAVRQWFVLQRRKDQGGLKS